MFHRSIELSECFFHTKLVKVVFDCFGGNNIRCLLIFCFSPHIVPLDVTPYVAMCKHVRLCRQNKHNVIKHLLWKNRCFSSHIRLYFSKPINRKKIFLIRWLFVPEWLWYWDKDEDAMSLHWNVLLCFSVHLIFSNEKIIYDSLLVCIDALYSIFMVSFEVYIVEHSKAFIQMGMEIAQR